MSKKYKTKTKYKNFKIASPILLVILIIASGIGFGYWWFFIRETKHQNPPPVYSHNQNADGFYYLNPITDKNDYYYNIHELQKYDHNPTLFVNNLHQIISSNYYKMSYGEVRYMLIESDGVRDENGNIKYVRGIYDNAQLPAYWTGSGDVAWQREHVWVNARLGMGRVAGPGGDRNQGSDAHNLRAISGNSGVQSGVNQKRSDLYYDGQTSDGNWAISKDKNSFFPSNQDKGDVARIAFYMSVMYPDILSLTNDTSRLNRNGISYTADYAEMGILDTLLKWNKEDPVDDFEINRNNQIYNLNGRVDVKDQNGKIIKPQGNRNPFIDHPEFAHLIWENKTVADLTNYDSQSVSYTLTSWIFPYDKTIMINDKKTFLMI